MFRRDNGGQKRSRWRRRRRRRRRKYEARDTRSSLVRASEQASEEETKLSDRLRDAFETRFEPAAIYDRAGNQLRFLNRKTSGRDVFHGGAPRASNYKSDDNPVGFLPRTPFRVFLLPSLAFSNLYIYPSASCSLFLPVFR